LFKQILTSRFYLTPSNNELSHLGSTPETGACMIAI
jgi:hypothetical protein